ncbi:MAG: hypothetical protein ACI83W_001521, partial [Marinoscillum sp.]
LDVDIVHMNLKEIEQAFAYLIIMAIFALRF